jgi:succinoglycan biosynthesis transport protein ExoP
MNIIKFLKIIYSKIIYLTIIPIIIGLVVYFLTKDLPVKYTTSSTIFTGVTTNNGLVVESIRIDNNATQSEYNNIMTMLKSTTLFEEISLHLLTQHLILTKPQKEIISEKSYKELMASVPDKVKKLVVKNNFDKTYKNLKEYIVQDEKNYIYRLMNYGHKYYGINSISTLKAERLTNSDLIKLSFESEDPGICFNTVKFATQIFVKNYSEIKVKQSSSAVSYFEQKLKEIAAKLDEAEQNLLDFNIDNDIINYYEQTEQVTTQQEKIEVRLQEVKMEYEASQAVLAKLEHEVEKRYNINLRNSMILQIREQLVELNEAITSIELDNNNPNKSKLPDLKSKKNKVESTLENKIDSMNIFDSKSQGIESQRLLSEWLDAVKNHENYSALFKSMKLRQIDFMKQFKRYAPLGATIKRIEREIDVYEREYLNVLHHLGLARQNQQSIDMRSNMKVLDETKFPINAIPSKNKLYVVIAVLFSIIFYLLGVFIIELMDARMKSPSLLKLNTGLDVIAAFTINNKRNKKYINTEMIDHRASLLLFEKVRKLSSKNTKPFVIQIYSSWDGAGKTLVANKLAAEIEKHNFSVTIVSFCNEEENSSQTKSTGSDSIAISNFYSEINKYEQYDTFITENSISSNYLISIFPPVSNGIDNTAFISNPNVNLIVYDANTSWATADIFMLDKLKSVLLENSLFAVLTYAEPDNLEEMYGDIPKKRSFIRKLLKKLLKRVM